MFTTDHIHNRPHSLQATFMPNLFNADHVHCRPRSWQITYTTDHVHDHVHIRQHS